MNSTHADTAAVVTASAPGTLMLIGEHAILHGQPCIACAVEQRIHITLSALNRPVLQIDSTLAQYEQPLAELSDHPELSFVLAAVRTCLPELQQAAIDGQGLRVEIESEFSHQVGLGSSSAICVAMIAALRTWLGAPPELDETSRRAIFEQARAVMLTVQGRGSGFDIAAATYGALIVYQLEPLQIQPLPVVPEIGLFYSGYKTPTPLVLAQVEKAAAAEPERYQAIYQQMGGCVRRAIPRAAAEDWQGFGKLMNEYQQLMAALGVSDDTLDTLIRRLQAQGVLGAKISGSGLGDCVLSLGPVEGLDIGYRAIPVRVSPQGVHVHISPS